MNKINQFVSCLSTFNVLILILLITLKCQAQDSNYKVNYVLIKSERSLKDISLRLKLDIKKLRIYNPSIVKDQVKRGDTIFLDNSRKNIISKKYDTLIIDSSTTEIILREVSFNNKSYFVCEVDPRKVTIELYNKLKDIDTISSFNDIIKYKQSDVLFIVNGGMYENDLTPVGLLVSKGKIFKELNTRLDGRGNFYQLPFPASINAVFLIDSSSRANIIPSELYNLDNKSISLATQSGPLMIYNGKINKMFQENSTNFNIRNGVGIDQKGIVYFVISKVPVTFYEFSRCFIDLLNCSKALYLDGAISQYYAANSMSGSLPSSSHLGVFISVSKRHNNKLKVPKEKKSEDKGIYKPSKKRKKSA